MEVFSSAELRAKVLKVLEMHRATKTRQGRLEVALNHVDGNKVILNFIVASGVYTGWHFVPNEVKDSIQEMNHLIAEVSSDSKEAAMEKWDDFMKLYRQVKSESLSLDEESVRFVNDAISAAGIDDKLSYEPPSSQVRLGTGSDLDETRFRELQGEFDQINESIDDVALTEVVDFNSLKPTNFSHLLGRPQIEAAHPLTIDGMGNAILHADMILGHYSQGALDEGAQSFYTEVPKSHPHDMQDSFTSGESGLSSDLMLIGACVGVAIVGVARKLPSFYKILQRERNLDELSSSSGFHKPLEAYGKNVRVDLSNSIDDEIDKILFYPAGEGRNPRLRNPTGWIEFVGNMPNNHIRRSLLGCIFKPDMKQPSKDQIELIKETERMLLAYDITSKGNGVRNEVIQAVSHSGDFADVVVKKIDSDIEAFSREHPMLASFIGEQLNCDFISKTKEYLGLSSDDLLIRSAATKNIMELLSSIKQENREFDPTLREVVKSLKVLVAESVIDDLNNNLTCNQDLNDAYNAIKAVSETMKYTNPNKKRPIHKY
ncbi:hypothetical protein VCHA53O466_50357 [Vibrio chagasii]|nr:hypothetical protein VCHA53O466_50357 [Vibrio chagasii]